MVAFKKCSADWNKGVEFHLKHVKRELVSHRRGSFERAEGHLDEARRMIAACDVPHALVERWRHTSRVLLNRRGVLMKRKGR